MSKGMGIFIVVVLGIVALKHPELISQVINGLTSILTGKK